MFGLSLPCHLIQGPAVRTWNCVAHFANLLWCKFNYVTNPIMPRSRRRHHSRSRTRSRSRSQSCDRDTKRRKIENYESPQHKRSDSTEDDHQLKNIENQAPISATSDSEEINTTQTSETSEDVLKATPDDSVDNAATSVKTPTTKTPQKALTPKQIKKKIQSEEKNKEREKTKEEKLKMLEEKKKIKREENEKRMKEKQEKLEQKQKEIEERQKARDLKEEKKKKERDERELKRKEKEEKEEQKRKEKEEKEEQKRKEQDEKQKLEEKKQKTVAAFVNFFKKKTDAPTEEKTLEENITSSFMPFEVKSDMRLAPILRVLLDDGKKNYLSEALETQTAQTYLHDLKSGNKIRKSTRTWPFADLETHDDVMIIADVNPGESIEEQQKIPNKQRAKFLKFDGNRRPAYFGTWRKKSDVIKPRKPFSVDNKYFDYDVDSDEEWEEEDDSGESLPGSDEDKENDSENEYEVDNKFFVPHGHLSDDEVNDEENAVESPEAHKAKLKLLKKEFDEEMQSKTERIKPRLIGCIWYKKDGSNVDTAINEFLKPLSIISKGPIVIKKRNKYIDSAPVRRSFIPGKELSEELIPDFLKWIHGSTKSSRTLAEEFLNSLVRQNVNVEVSKTSLGKQLKKFAAWTRCPEGGPVLKKYCWFVHKIVGEEYNVNLPIPF